MRSGPAKNAARLCAMLALLVSVAVCSRAKANSDNHRVVYDEMELPEPKGWSVDLGMMLNISRGEGRYSRESISVYEYGLALGAHYQFSKAFSLGAWFELGTGDETEDFLSHYGGGLNVLFGDKVGSAAFGPVIGVDSSMRGMAGLEIFYKGWFIRPCASYDLDQGGGFQAERMAFHLNIGVSFFLGG